MQFFLSKTYILNNKLLQITTFGLFIFILWKYTKNNIKHCIADNFSPFSV